MSEGEEHRLSLEEPTADLSDSYRSLVEEFVEYGEKLIPFPLAFPYDDFPKLLERLAAESRGEGLPPGFVPHSTFWLVLDGTSVVGVSNLRHRLTDSLRRDGGHIGYGVRPSARGFGYASVLLRLTLRRAAALGLPEVLLTCDKTNIRSASVILRNRGILESEEFLPEHSDVVQRYWIAIETES